MVGIGRESSVRGHWKAKSLVSTLALCLVTLTVAQGPGPPGGGEGHYDVSYSGGTWISTGGQTATDDYYRSSGSYGFDIPTGGGYWFGFGWIFTAGPGTADGNGGITATFTWDDEDDPSNLPPDAVLVKEYCRAEWAGDSGHCANGLSDPPVATADGEKSEGTHWYAKQDPGTSFVVPTRSPFADSEHEECEEEECVMNGQATVWYKAEVIPATLVFAGLHPDYDKLMIGQKLTSTAKYDGAPTTPGQDTFSWTISPGGDEFADWTHTLTLARKIGWTSPNEKQMVTYFADPMADIEIEVTVNLAAVTGSFTVSGKVTSVAPEFNASYQQGKAWWVDAYGVINRVVPDTKYLQLWDTTYLGNQSGFIFKGWADTPDIFDGTVATPTHGDWNWTQVVTATTMVRTDDVGDVYDFDGSFSGGDPKLDTTDPYDGDHDADRVEHYQGDAPFTAVNIGLTLQQRQNGVQNLQLSRADEFIMYMLYKPHGTGAKYVPLTSATWHWAGDMEQSSGIWIMLTPQVQGFTPSAGFPVHPKWTGNITGILTTWTLRIP